MMGAGAFVDHTYLSSMGLMYQFHARLTELNIRISVEAEVKIAQAAMMTCLGPAAIEEMHEIARCIINDICDPKVWDAMLVIFEKNKMDYRDRVFRLCFMFLKLKYRQTGDPTYRKSVSGRPP